jgi:hypothetical protein
MKNISPSGRRQTNAVFSESGNNPKLNVHFPNSKSKKLCSPGKRRAKRSQSKPTRTASESRFSDVSLATTRRGVASSRHLPKIRSASSLVVKELYKPYFIPWTVIPPFALKLMRDLKRQVKKGGPHSCTSSSEVQAFLQLSKRDP